MLVAILSGKPLDLIDDLMGYMRFLSSILHDVAGFNALLTKILPLYFSFHINHFTLSIEGTILWRIQISGLPYPF